MKTTQRDSRPLSDMPVAPQSDIKRDAEKLMELRAQISEMKAAADEMASPLEQERDALQAKLMASFKELGTATMRFPFGTFSVAVRKTPRVGDERKVVAYLQEHGLDAEYVDARLTDTFLNNLRGFVKDIGVVDGLEISEKEFMSISSGSENEDKRKVVE